MDVQHNYEVHFIVTNDIGPSQKLNPELKLSHSMVSILSITEV